SAGADSDRIAFQLITDVCRRMRDDKFRSTVGAVGRGANPRCEGSKSDDSIASSEGRAGMAGRRDDDRRLRSALSPTGNGLKTRARRTDPSVDHCVGGGEQTGKHLLVL